jgi:hypothetical protein
MLKEEVAVLSEKLVFEEARSREKVLLEERMQLDKLEREMSLNRQILQEVTFDQNCLRQAFNNPPAPTPNPVLETKQTSV